MKQVFDSAFIADKPESLVDQKPCDRTGRHSRVLRMFPAVNWKPCSLLEIRPLGASPVENAASVGASTYEVKMRQLATFPPRPLPPGRHPRRLRRGRHPRQ